MKMVRNTNHVLPLKCDIEQGKWGIWFLAESVVMALKHRCVTGRGR